MPALVPSVKSVFSFECVFRSPVLPGLGVAWAQGSRHHWAAPRRGLPIRTLPSGDP